MKLKQLQRGIQLFLILFSTIALSQVQKLSELSSGKYIDSKIIYDDDTNDVFGYFFLYQKDSKSKDQLEIEYLILDKNLNKITSNTFNQIIYNHFLIQSDLKLSFVKKIDNEIIFELFNKTIENNLSFNHRYRKIDLNNFKLSSEIVFKDFKPVEKNSDADNKIYISDFIGDQKLENTKGNYFFTFSTPELNPKSTLGRMNLKKMKSIRSFGILDRNFNLIWDENINKNDKLYYTFFNSDSEVFLLKSFDYDKYEKNTIDIYDYEKGLISKYSLYNLEYKIIIDETIFTENEIVFFVKIFDKNDSDIDHDKTLGLGKIVLNKKTGEQVQVNYKLWSELTPELIFKNKYGEIEKYGKIEFQDYVLLKNGNALIIAEGFKKEQNSKILDLFIFEVDNNLNVKYFKKIEKNSTSLKKIKFSGNFLKRYGAFDFLYSQKLDNEDNFVFFYVNNEKEGSRRAKRNNPEWVLGIITYVDGEFNNDKLELTKKDIKIIPGKAKNGYIRLLEIDDDNLELRLEKINY